jgi:nitronate monooxygenase
MRRASPFATRLPIIQAPMAGVQGHALAAAVSAAGALGSLPAAMHSPESLDAELHLLRAAGDLPFNVNFFCHAEAAPDPARERAWVERLAPYYREFGLDPASVPAGPARAPFDARAAEIVERHRPAVVSFHFGLPGAALLARVKATGAIVMSSATTMEEGLWLEAHGADVVIAQGLEAGGHRGQFLREDPDGQLGTRALVAALVARVGVPVIAAGGIGEPDDVAACLALGAAGVQVGTAYLCCPEATTTPLHRHALAAGEGPPSAITRLYTGRPTRGLVTRLMRELDLAPDQIPAFPRAAVALAPLRAAAEARGFRDFTPLWRGAGAAPCRSLPAAEVTARLALGSAS